MSGKIKFYERNDCCKIIVVSLLHFKVHSSPHVSG
jgi:hypothetical protein